MKEKMDLYDIALQFRTAIEEAVKNGKLKKMESFPYGCCGMASDLLQRYMIEQYGLLTWYMSGEYGSGWVFLHGICLANMAQAGSFYMVYVWRIWLRLGG